MNTDKEILLNELTTALAENEQVLAESRCYGIDPAQQEQNIADLKAIIAEIS